MGAGYKSRCSDLERWQQYATNEFRWAGGATNFNCPFHFISKETNPEEQVPEPETALGNLNDTQIANRNRTRYISLEEFNVKKLNVTAFEEWENIVRQRAFSKRKVKGEDGSRPKTLKTQKSKLFLMNTYNNENTKKDPDLKEYRNPLYYIARDEIGAASKLLKLMEFRRLLDKPSATKQAKRSQVPKEGSSESLREMDKKKKRSLRKSMRNMASPRSHKSTEYVSPREYSSYRTSRSKTKRKRSSAGNETLELFTSRLPPKEPVPQHGRLRSATTTDARTLPPELLYSVPNAAVHVKSNLEHP